MLFSYHHTENIFFHLNILSEFQILISFIIYFHYDSYLKDYEKYLCKMAHITILLFLLWFLSCKLLFPISLLIFLSIHVYAVTLKKNFFFCMYCYMLSSNSIHTHNVLIQDTSGSSPATWKLWSLIVLFIIFYIDPVSLNFIIIFLPLGSGLS